MGAASLEQGIIPEISARATPYFRRYFRKRTFPRAPLISERIAGNIHLGQSVCVDVPTNKHISTLPDAY